ncbi:MAG: uL30 family ribosomal protein, partial [archaeon]
LRGKVNVPKKTEDTLKMLKLKNTHNCRILPENENYEGMLKKVEGYITWGEINQETLEKLLEKKEVKKPDEIEEKGIEKILKLHPPKGGFKKSKKRHYNNKGELGYRGEEINQLIQRMI